MERCNRLPGLPQRRPPRLALAAAKVSIPRVLAPALGCFLSPTRPDKGQGPGRGRDGCRGFAGEQGLSLAVACSKLCLPGLGRRQMDG